MANAAVPTSIARISSRGISSRRRAPRGGAVIAARPFKLEFKPATRVY